MSYSLSKQDIANLSEGSHLSFARNGLRKMTGTVTICFNRGGIHNNFDEQIKESITKVYQQIRRLKPELPEQFTGKMQLHYHRLQLEGITLD